jgi:type I restriction enzyme S subunit
MSEANGQHLPPGWVRAPLGSLVEPRTGKANPQATPKAKFIGMEQVEPHTMRLLGTVPCSTMKSGANTFQPFDVLYGRMRAYLNKVYQPDFSGLCSGEFIVLPETCAVLGRFLKYRLNSGDFVRFANHLNSGDRPRVDFDQIKVFNLLLPPKSEQERIAGALDELLSDLDAGVAALERVQAKLKHYRAVVLKAAVEGALTAEWRTQHFVTETASALLTRILAERRRRWEETQLQKFKDADKTPPKNWKSKYREPVAPNTTNMPALPNEWRWVRLGELLFEIEAGKSFTCVPRPANLGEWGIIKVSAMSWGSFDETENKTVPASRNINHHYEIRNGDILLSRANTYELVGASVLVKSCRPRLLLSDKSMRLLHSPIVDKVWLKTMLGSPWVRRQLSRKSTGTKEGMRNVSQESVLDVVIPLAPAVECLEIVEVVEDQLSVIEHLEADLEAKLKSAQALRQSILRLAFTGQLVPQDPNDEPASELLKRIATQREELTRLAQAAKQPKRTKFKPERNARHKTQPKSPRKRSSKHTLTKESS